MFRFLRRLVTVDTRTGVLLLLTGLVVLALFLFRAVLLPFALGIFLAYLLAPIVAMLTRLRVRRVRMPRGAAILLLYVIILGLMILSGFFLFPKFYGEVNRMVKTLPQVFHDVEDRFIAPAESYVNSWVSQFVSLPDLQGNGNGNNNGLRNATAGAGASTVPASPSNATGTAGTRSPGGSALPGHPGSSAAAKGPGPDGTLPPWRAALDDYTYVVRRVDDTHYEVIPQRRESRNGQGDRKPFTFNRQMSQAFDQFRTGFEENVVGLVVMGRRLVAVLVSSFFTLFLVLMISGFLLLDPQRINGFLASLVPQQHRGSYDDWVHRLDHGLSGVVRGQVMICLINGILTGIGVTLLGIPFVVTLSVIAALFSLIPIFGVLISSIPILLMGLTVSLGTAVLALGWILVIHFLEGNFLNPKILGDSAKIHPVLIVFALAVGEHLGGVLGALLAVPIFSLVQNSFLFLKQKAEGRDVPV